MADSTEVGGGPTPGDAAKIDSKGNLVGIQRLKANELNCMRSYSRTSQTWPPARPSATTST